MCLVLIIKLFSGVLQNEMYFKSYYIIECVDVPQDHSGRFELSANCRNIIGTFKMLTLAPRYFRFRCKQSKIRGMAGSEQGGPGGPSGDPMGSGPGGPSSGPASSEPGGPGGPSRDRMGSEPGGPGRDPTGSGPGGPGGPGEPGGPGGGPAAAGRRFFCTAGGGLEQVLVRELRTRLGAEEVSSPRSAGRWDRQPAGRSPVRQDWLRDGLYEYCTRTVLVLYSYYTPTVLLLYSYCTRTILVLYSYCTPTVLVLYSYYTRAFFHDLTSSAYPGCRTPGVLYPGCRTPGVLYPGCM